MSFSANFPNAILLNTLGDDVVYLINGVEYLIKAVVDKDVESVGGDFHMPERRTEIEFLKSDIPRYPVHGDRVLFGDYSLIVDSVLDDDGYLIRLAMRNG